jgi:hypothetical protein
MRWMPRRISSEAMSWSAEMAASRIAPQPLADLAQRVDETVDAFGLDRLQRLRDLVGAVRDAVEVALQRVERVLIDALLIAGLLGRKVVDLRLRARRIVGEACELLLVQQDLEVRLPLLVLNVEDLELQLAMLIGGLRHLVGELQSVEAEAVFLIESRLLRIERCKLPLLRDRVLLRGVELLHLCAEDLRLRLGDALLVVGVLAELQLARDGVLQLLRVGIDLLVGDRCALVVIGRELRLRLEDLSIEIVLRLGEGAVLAIAGDSCALCRSIGRCGLRAASLDVEVPALLVDGRQADALVAVDLADFLRREARARTRCRAPTCR